MSVPSLADLRGLLVDLDGVVYAGGQPLPGAAWFLGEARRRGLPFLLVTNNSTASQARVAERLRGMGIQVQADEILTSAEATAAYVRRESPAGASVLAIGEDGLVAAIEQQGLTIAADGDAAEWVVVGLDRRFDYAKLAAATRAILGGARFVATNADVLLPVEGGRVVPGAGSLLAAISAATGVAPEVIGKPEPGLFQRGLERLRLPRAESAAMVGDRLDTDIVGGQRAGLRTVLVLSGVTKSEDLAAARVQPDLVVANLAALGEALGWGSPGPS